ncbi:MAG: hypothetical protein QW814_01740 [Methanothrix sp.]
MFKNISAFEVDGKSRLVVQLPLPTMDDEKAQSARTAARNIAEGVLGGMPKATISLSNNVSDPSSLVSIDKYEFIINDAGDGRKVLMLRSYCEDPYDPKEANEFISVTKAIEKYLKTRA